MAQNVTVQGASYSDVPAVTLPKTGGGSATFYDTTIASNGAAATDIASGKLAYVNGSLITGTATGGSSWTKIGNTTELTVSTTSTSAASAGTVSLGSGHFTKDKIIYVRIRDKSGKRNGYFYGSDSFFMNWRNANGSTSTLSACAQEYYRCNSDGTLTGTSGAYGVYGYSLTTDGTLTIRRRYNSTNTLTINSTYLIDVYELTPPQALF